MSQFMPTERTQVRRLPDRAAYDAETIFRILDEGWVCHIGFVVDDQPYVIPTGYGRIGDRLYIHGSAASRMLRTLAGGVQVCVTVTLLDGLVLARSAFHHSMNYRSVVILGRARPLEGREEKLRALEALTNHIVPGRWKDVRQPNETELKATTVLELRLSEVSAKIRTGPPKDEQEDYRLAIWGGVLPLRLVAAAPVADSEMDPGIPPPSYLRDYTR